MGRDNTNSVFARIDEQIKEYITMDGDTLYVDGDVFLLIGYHARIGNAIEALFKAYPNLKNIDFGDTSLTVISSCIHLLRDTNFKVISSVTDEPIWKEEFNRIYLILIPRMNKMIDDRDELANAIVEDMYGNPNGLKYQIASKAWRDEDECKEKVIKALGAVMETGSYREKK